MTKRNNLSTIAPPARRADPIPATTTTSAGDQVAINVRINEDRASYLRMLSAKTRTPQRELIMRAIDLLRQEAGEL